MKLRAYKKNLLEHILWKWKYIPYDQKELMKKKRKEKENKDHKRWDMLAKEASFSHSLWFRRRMVVKEIIKSVRPHPEYA